MEGYACVCARIRHPCRMGAYAPVWGGGLELAPAGQNLARKTRKTAQISNHASIMRPMRMRPTRIRHPQRMAEIRMALLSHSMLPDPFDFILLPFGRRRQIYRLSGAVGGVFLQSAMKIKAQPHGRITPSAPRADGLIWAQKGRTTPNHGRATSCSRKPHASL